MEYFICFYKFAQYNIDCMKKILLTLMLLSSYSVFAQEYVKVFDDKEMDYYAYSQCEQDKDDNYLLWTKQVIKKEQLTKLRNRMVIEMQSNKFMALSYIVQLFKYDFENKRYCVASLVYYNADGRVIYEDNDILHLWKYIQPETYVDSYYQVAKRFANSPSQTSKTISYTGKVYDVVEQMPSFLGGNEALMKFIKDNITYPDPEACVQGRVVVKFIVERDGSISHAQIARSLDPIFDKEALRVVNNMPKWIPGKQNGKTVRVSYNVPVSFRMD